MLEAAYGPDHPELGVLRHRISAMHGAARDGNGMPVSFAAAPEMPRKQLNSARGGSAGAFGAALPAPTPRGQSSSAEGASATGVAASAAPAPAGLVPSLTLPSGTPAPAPALVLPPDVVLKNFSSQRMRALEARQRRSRRGGRRVAGVEHAAATAACRIRRAPRSRHVDAAAQQRHRPVIRRLAAPREEAGTFPRAHGEAAAIR